MRSEAALVIGSGGREHALVEVMVGSAGLDRVYCAPGNAGTEMISEVENVGFGPGDIDTIVGFAREKQEEADLLVVVGPEAPLVRGLGDQLRAAGVSVFGPNANAARLEGSKTFADEFMRTYGIPRPVSYTARTLEEGYTLIRGHNAQKLVLKADGLAGGKGVVLPRTQEEAEQTLTEMLTGQGFDEAGKGGVVIQERLTGPEVSAFVISDGKSFSVVPFLAQDHKRRDTGDTGPNTGGMGAYAPIPADILNQRQIDGIEDIAAMTISGMADRGTPYQGVLYMGLMLAEEYDGKPVVIEYNARFGDPEAEVVLPVLAGMGVNIYDMLRMTAAGRAPSLGPPRFVGRAALTVCLAAEGYPSTPRKGDVIHGLGQTYPNTTIHHGGTQRDGEHTISAGGRVLYVTGQGETVDAAAQAAYAAIGERGIHFAGMHYRTDIGHQARSDYHRL